MEKDAAEFGKHSVVVSFMNNAVSIRRADGSLVTTGIVLNSFMHNALSIRRADGSLITTGIVLHSFMHSALSIMNHSTKMCSQQSMIFQL